MNDFSVEDQIITDFPVGWENENPVSQKTGRDDFWLVLAIVGLAAAAAVGIALMLWLIADEYSWQFAITIGVVALAFSVLQQYLTRRK